MNTGHKVLIMKCNDYDIIVCDYQMPVMTGLEFCKQMRLRDETREIPAIMLTARGFDVEEDEMAQAGISAVLAKPFSPREVLERVTSLLDGSVVSTEAARSSSTLKTWMYPLTIIDNIISPKSHFRSLSEPSRYCLTVILPWFSIPISNRYFS